MVISEHQLNNVLRVYGDQIRQRMISNRPEDTDTNAPEMIGIFATYRRKSIIDGITSNIIKRITRYRPNYNIKKEVFKTLESEREKSLVIEDNLHNKLIYKKIDGINETINSLSIEDSTFLTNKLW